MDRIFFIKLFTTRRILLGVAFSFFLLACGETNRKTTVSVPEIPGSNLPGDTLAMGICGSCHSYVKPQYLSRKIWQDDVLPSMGFRLGIYPGGLRPDSLFEKGPGGQIVKKAGVYPEKPILAQSDWQKIVRYYLDNAPDTILPPSREKKITMGLKHFNYRESKFSHRPAFTTMVKILPNNRGIVFGDTKPETNNFTFLAPNLEKAYNVTLQNAPVHYYEKNDTVFLTTIGRNIFPHDSPDGAIQKITKAGPNQQYTKAELIISNLQRPVHVQYADLNGDSMEDILVCEYGNLTGKLVWFQNEGPDKYTMRPLKGVAGAISTVLNDLDGDGLSDIIVLLAQGDESVVWFRNKGNGLFEETRLLSFLPLYGSQYIEMADFNKDGFSDLLYVCGDNADLTPILKNYHGIYIYLNDGQQHFSLSYFYQLNGAYKAMARDFDKDGDLDIAAISYFPDYHNYPEESFVYLENRGNNTFNDYSFPEAANGRWIVMDAADMDGDQDIDIVLGSNVIFQAKDDPTGLGEKWFKSGPSVIVLENTIR